MDELISTEMTQTPIFQEHYVNNGPNMSINTKVNGICIVQGDD